ncbi:unnamed protein product [Mycena citricolor]|uniref:Shugoshin C-terminal domain-containing protein n=1 Tax=Mycena citricolor TaxID=2018698 RepID=A0AAD2Q0Z3_9AGAR|nr:unnamed protein product [Mycena citricolor]
MSRRESRVSTGVRQNDALVEFENFKKKFLLANKHITKLNSTLSMKIEELNTEITTLYTENLRLRTSEIALAAQVKRERETSRKILLEAETATQALMRHLSNLRETYNVPLLPTPSPTPPRRANVSPRTSIYANNLNRLSREPQVPLITEDEEPEEISPSPPRKTKKKRLSASRLPLPARESTPPPADMISAPAAPMITAPSSIVLPSLPIHLDLTAFALPSKKRRQSGLLLDFNAVPSQVPDPSPNEPAAGRERYLEQENERAKEKERKRRSREEGAGTSSKPKARLKDVTNSNSPRARPKPELAAESAGTEGRPFLAPSPPSPGPPEPKLLPVPVMEAGPSSARAAPAAEIEMTEAEAEADNGGRERRARKSVNYAEPKLNTKMRKPQTMEDTPVPAKRARSSTAGTSRGQTRRLSPPIPGARALAVAGDDEDPGDDVDEESDGWADGEFAPSWAGNVNVETRRRSNPRRTKEGEWAREGRRHSSAA